VIYSTGEVTECETKNTPLGNLRETGYDFPAIWSSGAARRAAAEAADGCFCTHECGHYSSKIYSLNEVARIGWKAFAGDSVRADA
jgi:hypothetical protein